MNKAILNFRKNKTVRKQAEKRFAKKGKKDRKLSSQDANKLVHELEVSSSKYADLYDFAPVRYFTLDKKGAILEANLAGAILLGIERSLLMNKPFSYYVAKDSQDIFFLQTRQVFRRKDKQRCEVTLAKKDGTQFYAQLESMAAVG